MRVLHVDWDDSDQFAVVARIRKAAASLTEPHHQSQGLYRVVASTFRSTNAHQAAYTFTICHITAGYSSAKTTRMTSSL